MLLWAQSNPYPLTMVATMIKVNRYSYILWELFLLLSKIY